MGQPIALKLFLRVKYNITRKKKVAEHFVAPLRRSRGHKFPRGAPFLAPVSALDCIGARVDGSITDVRTRSGPMPEGGFWRSRSR